MRCTCLNITTEMLSNQPELALRLGSACNSCPLLTVEETERRSGNDRRAMSREPKGRRREDNPLPVVVEVADNIVDFIVEKDRQPPLQRLSYKEKKDHIKVYITLDNEESFFAQVYVKGSERLQDLMNDNREFIPILKLTPRGRGEWVTAVIRKSSIISIEER